MKKYLQLGHLHIVGIVLAVFVAGYLYLVNSVMPKYISQMLPVAEEMAKDYINGSVKIGGASWNGALTAEFNNVIVKDIQNKEVAVLPKTRLSFRPWLAIFKPARALTRIAVEEPALFLRLDDNGQWNMATLMKESESTETPFYGLLEVNKGKLNVETNVGKWKFDVDGNVNGGANPNFEFDVDVKAKDNVIKVGGLATTKGVGKIQVNTKKLSFNEYASLVKYYTNINDFAGDLLNTHLIFDNDGKKATVSGEAEFADIKGIYAVNDAEKHSFKLAGSVKAKESIVDLQRLDAVIDEEQELHLHGKADVHDLDNVGGQGLLTSPRLAYKGYEIEKLHLPFTVSKKFVQIDSASVSYGGGKAVASATADLRDETLTADIDLNNIKHKLSTKPGDEIHANGAMAVLVRPKTDKDNQEQKIYELHVAADTVNLKWQDLLINKMALDGDVDGKKITINHFSAQTGDGVIALKGSAIAQEDGALALTGRMADLAVDPLLYHFADIKGKGKLSMNFDIKGTVASPEFGSALQLRDVEAMDLKMREMHGFVSVKDKVVTIKNMGATLTRGRHLFNGTIDLKADEPVFNMDIESRHVRVEPLIALVTKDYSLTGNLDNKMHISGTAKHPRVAGNMNLTDGSVQTYLLKGISGKYLYDDGFINLQDFIVGLFVADIKFAGTMTKDQKLDFDIVANNVDISKSPYLDRNLSIEGLLNVDGHIDGYVANPLFNGSVESKELKINGETYTDIAGNVNSDMKSVNTFDIGFKQPYKKAGLTTVAGEGVYSAKGNLDIVNQFLAGQVLIQNGDINGLLRTDKLDYAVEGNIDGKVDICPQGKGSGIVFELSSHNLKTHDLTYDDFIAKGTFKNNVLNLENLLLKEDAEKTGTGYIRADGTVDIAQKVLDVHASAMEANPRIVNIAMKEPLKLKGYMNMDAALTGSFDNPKAQATLDVVNGSFSDISFDKVSLAAKLENDTIHIEKMDATRDVYGLYANGLIPVDALRARADRKNASAEMNLSLNLDNTELGVLTAFKQVDWATGNMQGNIILSGTLDSPKVNGSLKLEDGTLKIKNVNPVFEKLQVDAAFNGSKIELSKLAAALGKKGTISADGYYDLAADDSNVYKFNVHAKDAEIAYTSMFKGIINSELEITPQIYRNYWQGSKTQSGTRSLIKGNVRLDDVVANVVTVDDSEVGSQTNVGLNLKVELGPKIHMLNPMLYDIWLSGGLDVKGGYYSQTTTNEAQDEKIINRHNNGPDGIRIDGKIVADKGSITYLRTPFKITKAELNWKQPGEILPYVKLDSWARFGKYRIFIDIDGLLTDVKNEELLKLTSSPPLERNTLVRMLTLQRETADAGNDITNDDLNNVMSAGLQMAVLGNVELWVKQTLGLDQFRVYTGKVNSGISFDGNYSKKELTQEDKNRYNVLISKYLTDKFMVGYTTSFNGDESIMYGQYDIGKHFNLTYSEKAKLDNKKEHWYGIEYRIDFK